MDNKMQETGKYTKVSLVLAFLKGNIRYFIISILSAMVVTGLDMISPQLIRTTVDSVLGAEPLELPASLMEKLEAIGGVAYLRTHIWVIGIAIVVLALFGAAMVAGVGAGIFGSYEDAAQVVTARSNHPVNPGWKKTYDEIYPIYHDIYARIHPLTDRIAQSHIGG